MEKFSSTSSSVSSFSTMLSYFAKYNNKRTMMVVLCIFTFFSLGLITLSGTQQQVLCRSGTLSSSYSDSTTSSQDSSMAAGRVKFIDLNQLEATSTAKERGEKVLILTPLKNAAKYLDRYFELIDKLTYPKHLISIAFLVSDTTDDTVDIIRRKADDMLNRSVKSNENNERNDNRYTERYDSVTIFEKDFDFDLPEDKRHTFELQPLRRSFMARSRNYLLSAALRDDHAWVLWLDVDLVYYPDTIIEDLQSVDVDVVVPNCLRETDDGSFWGYDKNNWQETDKSLAIQSKLDPDHVLLEGYYEFLTERYLMVDMPTHGDPLRKVPLDGVGATFTLVKSHVHREGANFPPYVYKHQVETEGFAKMAKAMGFGVYVIILLFPITLICIF
ncbi:Anp1-domain-containing protein [Mycotypha africana]|uniref:Anp1-domain-containing protein n=1 Tax=Mycotypha africana TaxID=64632 RepID=UPI002301BFCD|nr:Anp1-domain-containing protein [Mycotypha africana]KAI8988276.1 Anp1-domain-containing protein [Mycotypha africana]